MKKLIYLAIIFISTFTRFEARTQGVAINADNSAPHASAILDVKSTTKGLLIPSMTTTQRNDIVSPAEGLIIYNTTTGQINQRQGGAWRFLLTSDYWVGGGSGQMFNIGDNIGINTAGPSERLDVSGNIRSNSSMIIDNASAILQLRSATVNKGFVQLSGDNLRFGTNSGNTTGNVVVRMNGNDRITINPQGDMDIAGKITNSAETGNSSLTPVCFGKFNDLGGIISGTGNFNVIRPGIGYYKVICPDINVNSIIIAMGAPSNVNVGGYISVDGEAELFAHNTTTGNSTDIFIQFIVYNP